MSRTFRAKAICAVVVMVSSACGNSTGPGTTNTGGQFFIRANIDGSAWQSSTVAPVSYASPGVYSVGGIQLAGANAYVLTIALFNIKGPGTYPLGVGPQVAGGIAIVSNTNSGWATPGSGAAGTIDITTLTATQIAGTFSFTASGNTGAAGSTTKTVTNGQFNLQLVQVGTVAPVPDNAGSAVSMSLNGAAWNAAAVTSNFTGSPTNLTIVASNLTHSFSITLANVTAAGTYPLSATTPVRTIGLGTSTAQVWSSSAAGGSGTVVVSSITATRIRGTFTATLMPGPGTTGTVAIANGTFDIGRLF